MGLFARLRERAVAQTQQDEPAVATASVASDPGPPSTTPGVLRLPDGLVPAWLPGPAFVQVAGETFHLDAIRQAEERAKTGAPLVAVLIPESSNPHDPNAVAVYLNGAHVGYIPRDIAGLVQPALVRFAHANGNRPVACPVEIRKYDLGPQVILRLNVEQLGLRAEDVEKLPPGAAELLRLLPKLDQPVPALAAVDPAARAMLAKADASAQRVDADYDRPPDAWSRVEGKYRTAVERLVQSRDPLVSSAWLGLARCLRYQRGRSDDTVAAYVEALYWDRHNDGVWHEFMERIAFTPHVPTLLAVYKQAPSTVRPGLAELLLNVAAGRDRHGKLGPSEGGRLRDELLAIAVASDDRGAVALIAGQRGLEAEKSGDLVEAVAYWRQAVAAGGTRADVADRFSIWLVKEGRLSEAAHALRQALAHPPQSVALRERMEKRLLRCAPAASRPKQGDGDPAPTTENTSSGVETARWYVPHDDDRLRFVGRDGVPPLHLISYGDTAGEQVLRLCEDSTGLLVAPTDTRLVRAGIYVSQLRGEAYHKAACRAGDFSPGRTVKLVREPNNEFDANAIAVYDSTGQHLAAYVNKQKARMLTKLMDAGDEVEAISIRGTQAGIPCDQIEILAAAGVVLRHVCQPRPQGLPQPAHERR